MCIYVYIYTITHVNVPDCAYIISLYVITIHYMFYRLATAQRIDPLKSTKGQHGRKAPNKQIIRWTVKVQNCKITRNVGICSPRWDPPGTVHFVPFLRWLLFHVNVSWALLPRELGMTHTHRIHIETWVFAANERFSVVNRVVSPSTIRIDWVGPHHQV